MKYFIESIDFQRIGLYNEASISLTKITELDSSLYKVYYLNAINLLMAANDLVEYSKSGTPNIKKANSLYEKAIEDLDHCIHLYLKQPKTFPESLIIFDEKYIKPDRTQRRLGEISVGPLNEDILEGVLIYITSLGKESELACKCWKTSRKKGIKQVNVLIKDFCK